MGDEFVPLRLADVINVNVEVVKKSKMVVNKIQHIQLVIDI